MQCPFVLTLVAISVWTCLLAYGPQPLGSCIKQEIWMVTPKGRNNARVFFACLFVKFLKFVLFYLLVLHIGLVLWVHQSIIGFSYFSCRLHSSVTVSFTFNPIPSLTKDSQKWQILNDVSNYKKKIRTHGVFIILTN